MKAQSNKKLSDKHPKTKSATHKVERRPRVELDDESEEDDDSLVAKIEVVNNKLDVLNKKKEADDKPAPKPASEKVKKSKPKHTKTIKKLVAAVVPHKKRSSVEILEERGPTRAPLLPKPSIQYLGQVQRSRKE